MGVSTLSDLCPTNMGVFSYLCAVSLAYSCYVVSVHLGVTFVVFAFHTLGIVPGETFLRSLKDRLSVYGYVPQSVEFMHCMIIVMVVSSYHVRVDRRRRAAEVPRRHQFAAGLLKSLGRWLFIAADTMESRGVAPRRRGPRRVTVTY